MPKLKIKMGTVSFSNTGGANSPAKAPTRTVCNHILWDLLSIFAAQQLCHHACPLACPGPVPPILLRRSQWHPRISQCQPTWGHCNTPRVGQPGSQGSQGSLIIAVCGSFFFHRWAPPKKKNWGIALGAANAAFYRFAHQTPQ